MENIVSNFGDGFERVHKQYIVNMNRIDTYDRAIGMIKMKEHIIPVGRKYKKTFNEKFMEK